MEKFKLETLTKKGKALIYVNTLLNIFNPEENFEMRYLGKGQRPSSKQYFI